MSPPPPACTLEAVARTRVSSTREKGTPTPMTGKRRRLLIPTVSLAVVALALGGCSDTVEEASTDYCTSLDDLNAEVASLRSLVAGDATQEQVSDQAEAVRGAYDATVTGSRQS